MIYLYNLLLLLLLPFLLPKIIRREGLRERLGLFPPLPRRAIWVHGVSVGEVGASQPLIEEIKRRFPGKKIILSTTTSTGRKVAQSLSPLVEGIFYFPLDLPWVVWKALRKIQPSLIILMETELWPNLIHLSRILSIPVVLANGRLSPLAFSRYRKISFLLRPFLREISLLLVQTERDKAYFLRLGAREESLRVVGNIKFDRIKKHIQTRLPRPPSSSYPVICAGSTHRGEEELVVEVFEKLRKEFPSARLILVPRHPERREEVEKILKERDLSYALRSKTRGEWKEAILLVDTVGELYSFYSLADLALMGGTFVPVGGHNPLEPLSLKLPVFFGPYTFNFEEIFGIIEGKGGIRVKKENLLTLLKKHLRERDFLSSLGEEGYRIFRKFQGATKRHLEEMLCAGLLDG